MDILEFAAERTGSSMEKIYDLQTQLLANIVEIDALLENLERLTLINPDDFDVLEDLFQKEFYLYMNNIGIYEDLIKYVEAEPRTPDNELELARIARDAHKMCRVEVVEL